MKAIVFDKIGAPSEVLEIRDIPTPVIGDNEVLVKMVSAPISPGDFLFIENLYPEPKKPKFPQQIAGNHGAGIVVETGRNVSIKSGTFVAFSYYNSWAEFADIPEEWLIPLPSTFPPDKASQFFNLLTAWDLLAQSRVQSEDWLVVTAGNSTVSTMVLQFARRKGANVIPIVRQARSDLCALGASAVVELWSLSDHIGDRIMDITGNKGIKALVDNVGGPVTGQLIQKMAFGGQVIINGGMSAAKFELHNLDVLLRGIEIKSYVYRYFFTPPPDETEELNEIAAASFHFKVPVGGLNRLDEFKRAVTETLNHPERGKQFFAN
jgi:NADPH:quinone reductase-like Zn-dependent oxidoreductase